jgi:outer membrane protein TolC
MQSAEIAYSTGSVRVLELLDSERTLLEVRLSLAQFQSDYMKALAEVERATGAAFPKVTP